MRKHAIDAAEIESRMPPWRKVALGMFPGLASKINGVETPYELWFELRGAFEAAYAQEPWDEETIRLIYGFADWCLLQKGGETAADDLGTCVCVCSYEHIPEHAGARADMPRWFTLAELETMRQCFSYQIGDADFRALRDYFRKKTKMFRPDLRKASRVHAQKVHATLKLP